MLFIIMIAYCSLARSEPTNGAGYDPNNAGLVQITEIQTTNSLFSGIAYRLRFEYYDGNVQQCIWDEEEQKFTFRSHHSSPDIDTLPDFALANLELPGSTAPDLHFPDLAREFYLIHTGYGDFFLRNGATGIRNIQIKCDLSNNCILSPADINQGLQVAFWSYLPKQNGSNVYILAELPANPKRVLDDGTSEGTSFYQFVFFPMATLERQVVSMNTTTEPTELTDDYFSNKKKLWRETVLNPSGVSKKKTLRETVTFTTRKIVIMGSSQKTLFGTKTRTGLDVEAKGTVPPNVEGKTLTTLHNDVSTGTEGVTMTRNEDITEETRVIEVIDEIDIPEKTCADVFFIMETGKRLEQKFSAEIRISAKIRRFGTSYSGISLARQWAPGSLIPQLLQDYKAPAGTLMLTRTFDAIYQDDGRIVTEDGIHTRFIVQEFEC